MTERKSTAGRKVAGQNNTEVYAAMLGELEALVSKLPPLWPYNRQMNELYRRFSAFKTELGKGPVASDAKRCAELEAKISMESGGDSWPNAATVAKIASELGNTVRTRTVQDWRARHPSYNIWRQAELLTLKLQAAHVASIPGPRSPETAWRRRPKTKKMREPWKPRAGDFDRLLRKLLKQRHLAISSTAITRLRHNMAEMICETESDWKATVAALLDDIAAEASDESPLARYTD